jgi:hypothetical protein
MVKGAVDQYRYKIAAGGAEVNFSPNGLMARASAYMMIMLDQY